MWNTLSRGRPNASLIKQLTSVSRNQQVFRVSSNLEFPFLSFFNNITTF